jgi:hypothetical protein
VKGDEMGKADRTDEDHGCIWDNYGKSGRKEAARKIKK